jgi:hypothetical protein
MFRVGKLFDKNKPILYFAVLLIVLPLVNSLNQHAWLEHGYVFTDWALQALFEISAALVFAAGAILTFFYGLYKRWSPLLIVLVVVIALLGLVFLLRDSGLIGRKAVKPVAQSATLNGVEIVLYASPPYDSMNLATYPMLRLERDIPGTMMREYKTLVILPHHMESHFDLEDEDRKIKLFAPASSVFREIEAVFDSSWSANIGKPTMRFDF